MKLLLTSSGFTNKKIVDALSELFQKNLHKANLVFVPTAANVEKGDKGWLVDDLVNCKKIGFASIDIVDISALPPRILKQRLRQADILVFGGGNTFHLMYWIKKTSLDRYLSDLLKERIYVGISAGSMVATPNLTFSQSKKLYYEDTGGNVENETALGFVKFLVCPHLNSPDFPMVRIKYLTKLANERTETIYVIDDQTAIKVIDDRTTVVSEGTWKKFN